MKPWTFAAAIAAAMTMTSAAKALDESLPSYQPMNGIAGELKSVGSDTLGNEMKGWAKGFMALYPTVKIEVEAKGSATAPPALLQGVSQFGPMSRFMTSDEATAFEKKYGYKATGVRVAVDALAVYVNKDNPVRCLTLQQVDQIFSSTRKGSGGATIKTWGDVGMSGEWRASPSSSSAAIRSPAPTNFSARPCCTAATIRPRSSWRQARRRSSLMFPATDSRSAIPASDSGPTAYAPFRSLPLAGGLALKPRKPPRSVVDIRLRGTCMSM
jgi:hypothetical protein